MAIAVYDSDLTSANGGQIAVGNTATDAGTWAESSNAAWDDQGGPIDETDFYINLANCQSAQATKTGQGTILYDHTSDAAVDTNGAVLVWGFWASPASLSTYANGGLKIIAGEDIANFLAWDCSGSDFEPNPLGGWYCYALDPAIGSADDTVGTNSAPFSCFGMAVNCTAQARGQPFAVNAIRVGRCTLEITLGDATAYGTFSGMETFDISTNQRYGLFQNIYGSYRWQGLMSLGTTATAVDFRDGNVSIGVANTPNVTSSFNKIEVHNATSNVEWTNVIMTSPGVGNPIAATASIGQFEAVDNATIVLTGCSFTDMGTFIFQSNTSAITTTFRRCGIITQAGAALTSCVVDSSAELHAILATNPGTITFSNFISDGAGHAVRCDTIGTYNWQGNTDEGYTGTRGTNLVSSTGSLDAMFYNNSGGLITLNVTSGGQQPSVRNGAGATTQVNANLSITYNTLINGSEVRVYLAGTSTPVDGIESVTGNSFSWSIGTGVAMDIKIFGPTPTPPSPPAIAYLEIIQKSKSFTADTSIDITQQVNRNYYDV